MILWPGKFRYKLRGVASIYRITLLLPFQNKLETITVQMTHEQILEMREKHPGFVGVPTLYSIFTEDEIPFSSDFTIYPSMIFFYPTPKVPMRAKILYVPQIKEM